MSELGLFNLGKRNDLRFRCVITDSEVLANAVLAEFVTELGVPTTVEDSYCDYMSKRLHEVVAAIEKAAGRAIPHSFGELWQVRTLARFKQDLVPIAGVREFIAKIFRSASLHRIILDATMARCLA